MKTLYTFDVDDGLASVTTEKEAIQLIRESRALCNTETNLWSLYLPNNQNVMASISEEECATIKSQDMDLSFPRIERELGVKWCITHGYFMFRV